MQIIVQTRFSFLGQSGWRSAVSRDETKLFAPQRLDGRFALFERITLPSLQHQTDDDFKLIVLTSAKMPQAYQRKLTELTNDMLGSQKVVVKFARPGYASRKMMMETAKLAPGQAWVAQVVLDDDDALAKSYVANLRNEISERQRFPAAVDDYAFFSFPFGLSMFIAEEKIAFARRVVPYTNLGLALLAKPGSKKSVFAVSHRKIGERHPSFLVETTTPQYVRTVHGTNDSRAIVGDEVISRASAAGMIAEGFPHLAGLDPRTLSVGQ